MPQLSPTMQEGVVEKIHLVRGAVVKCYDLALQVSTLQLTSVKLASEPSRLQVEIIEDDLTVCAVVAKEGDVVKVGDPIVVLSDGPLSIDVDMQEIVKHHQRYQKAMWQGYVMSATDAGACGCS